MSVKIEAPDPPGILDGEALAEWCRLVPQLIDAGLMTRLDRSALAAYCLAWDELVRCTNTLNAEGRFLYVPIQNAKGETLGSTTKPHPALAAQRDALGRVKAYLAEFGLSPASRAKMRATDAEEDDEFERVFGRASN